MTPKQKQKKDKLLNIRLLFILVSLAEILGTLGVSAVLSWLSKMLAAPVQRDHRCDGVNRDQHHPAQACC